MSLKGVKLEPVMIFQKGIRRVVNNSKYNDWADLKFEYVQTFKLTTKGITDKILTQPSGHWLRKSLRVGL